MKEHRNNDLRNKSIDIYIAEGVSIGLRGEEYVKFMGAILPDMQKEIQNTIQFGERTEDRRKACTAFINEIREFFYDCDCGEYCLLKDKSELKLEALHDMLDRHSKLLGFR